MSALDLFDVPPLDIDFPPVLPAPVDLLPVVRGMTGPQGPKGDVGDPADVGEMPDLSLIFDNGLAGPL